LLKELKRNNRFKKGYVELEDPVLHDMAMIALSTGARASEIFNIKGSDVNF
jgi:integrase